MILIFFVLAFLVFAPPLGAADLSILPICALAIYYLSKNGSKELRTFFKKDLYIRVLLLLIFFAFTLAFSSALFNSYELAMEFMFKPVRMMIIILCLYVIFLKNSDRLDVNNILIFITIMALLNAFVVYAQYICDYLGISPMIVRHPDFSETVVTPYRKPGFSSGYPTAGFLASFGSLYALYCFISRSQKMFVWLFIFLLIVPSVFLTARTTMFFFLGAFPLVLILTPYFLSTKSIVNGFSSIIKSFFILISISGIAAFAWFNMDEKTKGTFDVMFEIFINYSENGTLSTYSSDDLVENHYKLPENQETWWVGDGMAPFSSIKSGHSDVSFVRLLYGNGLPAVLVYVSVLVLSFVVCLQSKEDAGIKMMVIIFYALVVVLCIKGPYLFSRFVGDAHLMVLVFQILKATKVKYAEN